MASDNYLLRSLSNTSYSFVVKGIIDEPPVSPVTGDQYLIENAKSESAFKNVPNGSIVMYDGTQWIISAPKNGDFLYNEQDNSIMYYAYVDGAYKWSISTKYNKNYDTNLIAKIGVYKNNAPNGNKYLFKCYLMTLKDYDDDSIPSPVAYIFKVNPNSLYQIKYYNTYWMTIQTSVIKSRADSTNRFLCIDDGTIYKFDGSKFVASHKAIPNAIYLGENNNIVLYDDKTDKVYLIKNTATILAGAPKTTTLDSNPPSDPRIGGLIKQEATPQSAIHVCPNPQHSDQYKMMNWMFFKYTIVHYDVQLTSSHVTNKQLTLPTKVAVGKSGAKSLRVAVNGVTQAQHIDYNLNNDNQTINWNGNGMDQLGFQELINNNKKIVLNVMYMTERVIKRD